MSPLRFSIQAVEKWFFLPGGFYHLVFTPGKLYVLLVSTQSPGQVCQPHGRGVAGAVVGAASKKIGDWHGSKLAEKIEKLEQEEPESVLPASKHNYSIIAPSIERIRLELYGSRSLWAQMVVSLNDRSGPFLRKNKRVFCLEPMFDADLGGLEESIRQVMDVPLEVESHCP